MEDKTQSNILENKKFKYSRLFKWIRITIILILIICIGILTIIPPIIMNDMVNLHVDFNTVYKPEDFDITANKLVFNTEDNIDIVGYEVYTQEPKAVVIFISGIHNPSVTSFFGHAKMLLDNGYASILYDMRAHGESEGNEIGLGYKEVLDTKAVVNYILESNKYEDIPIVVYGLSMGGATAINSIGEISEIDGLISLSAYSSWEDVFCDNIEAMGAPAIYAQIQKPFVKLYTVFKYGFKSYDIIPKKEIMKLGDRPALIIHSSKDSQVFLSNFERIIENAPEHVETWVIEGDNHMIIGDMFLTPSDNKQYSKKIITFLNNNFGK